MTNKITYALSSVLLVAGLSACDTKTETTTETKAETKVETAATPAVSAEIAKASESVTILNTRIRPLPPGQKVTAMYMQLKNSSANNHDLVKVEGDISDTIELHAHTMDNGVMKMGQVESIPVAANSTAEAKPGGYHVMLMGLKKDLVIGEKFDFTLTFKDGSSQSISAEIKTLEVH